VGAAYWATIGLNFLSSRERLWAHARTAVTATTIVSAIILVATLLHLNRFHLDSPYAWVWIILYCVIPPLFFVLTLRQLRVPGDEPIRRAQFPGWMRTIIASYAVVLLAFGIPLFLVPQSMGLLWVWTLTPLTGQVIAAWLIGLGVIAVSMAWENDFQRVRAPMVGFATGGALEIVALARYPGNVNWTGVGVWVYILFLVSTLAIGLYGSNRLRRVD
jgi:hypothetical protein